MSKSYVAIGMTARDFVRDYPDVVGVPVGGYGFAAFGGAPVVVSEALSRPDLASTRVYVVLVDDTDLYLGFRSLDDEENAGYPPAHIKLAVTSWGRADPKDVRERVTSRPSADGTDFKGVILPEVDLTPADGPTKR